MEDLNEFRELKVEEVEGENEAQKDDYFRMERESILKEARVNRNFLKEHPEVRNDREIVLEAVKRQGCSLEDASVELRNDHEIVLQAVKGDGRSLQFASEELRNDREIVLGAVRKNGWSLQYASEELRNDRGFVLEAVKTKGSSLEYASVEFQNDHEIVLQAVKKAGRSLCFASVELRNDREIVLQAVVRSNGYSLKFASMELRNDREIVLEAVKENGRSLCFASVELRNDREIVLQAVVRSNGFSLKFASMELRNDREIVLEAVKENGMSLACASEELRNNREIVLGAVRKNGCSLQYASIELRNDREIVLEAVKVNGRSLEYAGEEFRNDREIVIEAVKTHSPFLEHASEELRNGREIVLEAVKRSGLSLKFVNNTDLIREVLKRQGLHLVRHIDQSVLKKHSILRLVKMYDGDLEKAYEEYVLGNVERDEVFKELFEGKFREKGCYVGLRGIGGGGDVQSLNFSLERVNEGEELEIQELQKKVSYIGFNDLEILRFLGRGSFGGTYLCKIRNVGGLFVAKFTKLLLSYNKRKELVERESLFLPYHKNVVSILSHKERELVDLTKFPDYEDYWKGTIARFGIKKKVVVGMILMKYHRMSLSDFCCRRNYEVGVSKLYLHKVIVNMFHKILEGVHHLHKNSIVHRDLHEGNIFLYPADGRVWIGDFGCALDLRKNTKSSSKFLVHKDHKIMFCVTGSSNYFKKHGDDEKCTAPEILNFDGTKEDYLNYEKSDIYSIGVLLKWFVGETVELSWNSNETWFGSCMSWRPLLFFQSVERLLADDPNDRIGFVEALGLFSEKASIDMNELLPRVYLDSEFELDEVTPKESKVEGKELKEEEKRENDNDDSEAKSDNKDGDVFYEIDFTKNYDFSSEGKNDVENELNPDTKKSDFQF